MSNFSGFLVVVVLIAAVMFLSVIFDETPIISLPSSTTTSGSTDKSNVKVRNETKQSTYSTTTKNESMAVLKKATAKPPPQNCDAGDSSQKYELGNLFYGRGSWAESAKDANEQLKQAHDRLDSNSIGYKYVQRSPGKPGNISVLAQIIADGKYYSLEDHVLLDDGQPWETALFHLRLGDNMVKESFFELNNFNNGGQAPKTRQFYVDLLSNKTVHAIKHVILMGSYCSGGWAVNADQLKWGYKYVKDLLQFLEDRGITVNSLVIGDSPTNSAAVDKDVGFVAAYASGGMLMVCSGGSFSTLLGAVVRENGGITFGCKEDDLAQPAKNDQKI